jgi:hypothetical protein
MTPTYKPSVCHPVILHTHIPVQQVEPEYECSLLFVSDRLEDRWHALRRPGRILALIMSSYCYVTLLNYHDTLFSWCS